MSQRISSDDLSRAIARYTRALAQHDAEPETPIVVASLYGQVFYVMRYDANRRPVHDVPGFLGSGGSGLLTKRAVYEALMLAASVLEEVGR